MTQHRCPCCAYVYDEARGDPHNGYPPGTPWRSLPDDWQCPSCSVREKRDFELPAAAPARPSGAAMG